MGNTAQTRNSRHMKITSPLLFKANRALCVPVGHDFLTRRVIALLVAPLLAVSLCQNVRAASTTFTGSGGNSDWSNPSNWTVLPVSGDDIVIDDSTPQNTLSLDGAQSVGTLTFGNAGTRTSAFAISGTNALTIASGMTASGNFTALGLTVTAPIIIGAAQTWSVGGEAGSPVLDRGVKLVNPTAGTQLALTLGGQLTKTGTGQLGFSGLNIGNGNILVSEGSLKLSAANATKLTLAGTGTLTIGSGAKLILSQGSTPTTSTFDISKAIRLENGAAIEVGGAAAFNSTNSKITSSITLAASSTTTLNALNVSGTNGSNFVFSGLWLGGSADSILEKTGASTVTFSNTSATAQTLAKLKVSGGTLVLNSSMSNGWRGDVEVANGATLKNQLADQINNASAVTVNGTWDLNSLRDIIGSLSGSGSIFNTGNAGGTTGLAINANSNATFSGTVAGTYAATTGGFSGTQTFTGQVTLTNLFVQSLAGTTGGISFAGNATAAATHVTLGSTSLATVDGTLRVTDNAQLTIGAAGITQGLGNGVVELGGGIGVATLAVNATGTSTGNISLTDGSGGSPTVDTKGFALTLAGTVKGTGGLTKSGTGTLITTGANTYGGETSINLGTLLVNGTHNGGGAYTVKDGSTLGGTGSFTSAVTVNAGGNFQPGASASIESLGAGTATFEAGSAFRYEVNSVVAPEAGADLLVVSGDLNLALTDTVTLVLMNLNAGAFDDGTKLTLINYTGSWNGGLFTYNSLVLSNGGTFSFNDQDWKIEYDAITGGSNFSNEFLSGHFVNITAVPEPNTLWMFATGMVALVVLRLRNSRRGFNS